MQIIQRRLYEMRFLFIKSTNQLPISMLRIKFIYFKFPPPTDIQSKSKHTKLSNWHKIACGTIIAIVK